MKHFTPLFLFCSFAAAQPARAQPAREELLEWKENRKLSWEDYKARPDPESDAAASTTTYLLIDYYISRNNFSYKIDSRFSTTRSWGLHKTDYILAHEQGHFDIAEVYARKLNQRMHAYQFNARSYDKDLKKIYEEVTQEKLETQNRYDRETNHSINREQQAAWLKKIAAMLAATSDWADY